MVFREDERLEVANIADERVERGLDRLIQRYDLKPRSAEPAATPLFDWELGKGDGEKLEDAVQEYSSTRHMGYDFRHSMDKDPLMRVRGVGDKGTGYVAPTLNVEGVFTAQIDHSKHRNRHVMFCLDHEDLAERNHLKLGRTYEIQLRVKPMHRYSGPKNQWALAFQVWGPSYPDGAKWTQPCMAVRYRRNAQRNETYWEVGFHGGDPMEDDPDREDWIGNTFGGSTWIDIDIRYHPAENGWMEVGFNAGERTRREGITCCTHNDEYAGMPTWGCYSYMDGAGFEFERVRVAEVA